MVSKEGDSNDTNSLIREMLKQVSTLQEKVDVIQKKSVMPLEVEDLDDEMEGSTRGLVELSETMKDFLEAAFLTTMPNEDRKKQVGKVGIPNCDQIRCLKLDGCTAQRRHKGEQVPVTFTHLVGRCGPPCSFAGKHQGRGFDARRGSFSHTDCPVSNGECAPADGTGTEKEADFEAESFFKIHGGGQQKLCFFSTNFVWGRIC